MSSMGHDIGALLLPKVAFKSQAIVAGGTGDGSAWNGESIDLQPLAGEARFNAAAVIVGANATLASGGVVTLSVLVQDSANNSDWATLIAATPVASRTASGAALSNGDVAGRLNVNLSQARRYIRPVVTTTLSATGTDTVVAYGFVVLANPDVGPVANPGV